MHARGTTECAGISVIDRLTPAQWSLACVAIFKWMDAKNGEVKCKKY
jgi:hypothetical protein